MGLLCSSPQLVSQQGDNTQPDPDPSYLPFILTGSVSLTGESQDEQTIHILRDTGAAQSIILSHVLPWSVDSSCGSKVLLQGIGMEYSAVPLHNVYISSTLVNGRFKVGVQDSLPVKGK